MGSSRSLIFFLLSIISGLVVPAISQEESNGVCTTIADYCWSCSTSNDTINNGSLYSQNLNTLLSSFSSNKANSGFYNSSLGQGSNKVNAVALCRGDLPLEDCHTCFSESISILFQNCTYQKEAIIWAERCTVHYSNASISGVNGNPVKYVPGPTDAANPEQFNLVLNQLLQNLSDKAAAGDSVSKFAAGHALLPSNATLYAIVQCRPDVGKQHCSDCIDEAISEIPQCCEGKDGGRVLRSCTCNLRFEANNRFYHATVGQEEEEEEVDGAVCTSTADYCWSCSYTGGRYTPGDMYQDNLNTLLSSFSLNSNIDYGFYNSSLGQDPNKVNGIALCRGGTAVGACHTCLNYTSEMLLQNCPNQKEAIIWGEQCMVQYSSSLIFGIEKDTPSRYLPSPHYAPDSDQFERVLNPLLNILSERAASGDSLEKFAAGHVSVPNAGTIFALAQCSPDIDMKNCSNCLLDAVSVFPVCCGGKSGGRVLKPSCNLRYEDNRFYGSTVDSQVDISALAPPPPPKQAGKKSKARETIIVIVVVLVSFVAILGSICIFLKMRKPRENLEVEGENSEEISLVESLQYEFETIRTATNDFSDANKLGRGGFGAVYKGRLSNGQYIAVKRLSKNSQQGDREFKNEVLLLAQLQHRNLVRLLGFFLKSDEKIIIYEYVPNKSLDHFLFDPNNDAHLDWGTRYKIIGGIGRGILYLHEDSRVRIIHRDLKASNILLDEDLNPKIADFGMARLFGIDQTQGDTKDVVGTYGYMAPEYAAQGRFSVKSDVFSFGVLVLEIVSGKMIGSFRYGENEEDLLSYAWRNWREDKVSNIVDPKLTTRSTIETRRCIHIGLLCVQENVMDRPTVASVVSMLNNQSITLSIPSRPAFYMHYNTGSDTSAMTMRSDESKNLSIYNTNNEPSNITEPYPR